MRLGEVVGVAGRLVRGSPELDVQRVVCDSRRVQPGDLFCALTGTQQDGARFVADALARGAVAVLSGQLLDGAFPLVLADDARRAMALAAAQLHRLPAARLTMLGVTGTNGKTSVSFLTEAMVRAAGRRTGLVGTVEWRVGDRVLPSSHTTPESTELQALLAEMVQAGVEVCAMEVSSHALVQSRVEGVRFAAAAFTQLTRDHLDYHGDMASYFAAKEQLFTQHLAAGGRAVVGCEDAWSQRLATRLQAEGRPVWRYGLSAEAELRCEDLSLSLAGFTGLWVTPAGTIPVRSPMVGRHNVENALAATGLALAAGVPLSAVAEALATCVGAPGRLEPVIDAYGRRVFVDYAHTDDALRRVLAALRGLMPPEARLVCVFGCGGDRDRGKRPLMGLAAGEGADVAVVTSDNPRTESPAEIIAQIVPGLAQAGAAERPVEALRSERGFAIVADRAEAIAAAVRLCRPGDALLIAGKGHEAYQLVGAEKRPFDDRAVAAAALREVVP